MRIIWVPLEPLPERYTEDWATWFPMEFAEAGVEYQTIAGFTLTDGIKVGSVLDAYGTNYYKSSQLMSLAAIWHTLGEDDVVFFADAWFPGVEQLAYMRAYNPKPKIVGILHAGTWDEHDFTVRQGMRPWAQHFERAMFEMFDLFFVATGYHKELIGTCRPTDKVRVTSLPFYPEPLRQFYHPTLARDPLVVFPHRLDPEKQPECFGELARRVQEQVPWARFEYTMPHFVAKGKPAYYAMLARAHVAVSFALQETFGYAMLEATALGCIPVVPNRLSYKELFEERNRYDTLDEAASIVVDAFKATHLDEPTFLTNTEDAIERMIDECRRLTA